MRWADPSCEARAVKLGQLAAVEALAQDVRMDNIRNLRPLGKRPYDGAGDDIRSAALDVWAWSVLLIDADRSVASLPSAAVRAAAQDLRDRLQHPSSTVTP